MPRRPVGSATLAGRRVGLAAAGVWLSDPAAGVEVPDRAAAGGPALVLPQPLSKAVPASAVPTITAAGAARGAQREVMRNISSMITH